MIIISILINHRINSFGYYVEFKDKNGNITETVKYKNARKILTSDYINKNISLNFLKYFNSSNLKILFDSFESDSQIDELRRTISSYITIFKIPIFQPKYLSTYFYLKQFQK